MFLYVIEAANYYIFVTINFYIIGCLGKNKNKKKISGICFITLIIIYYKTSDPKIF